MGLFSKASRDKPIASRNRPIDRAVAKALSDVEDGARRGLSPVSVQVRELPVGHGRLDQTVAAVAAALQERGHSVSGVEVPDWGGIGFVQVLPAAAPSGSRAVSPPEPQDSLVDAVHAAVSRYREWFHEPSDAPKIWGDRDALEKRIRAERPKDAAGVDRFIAECGADWFWVNGFAAFAGFFLGHRESLSGVSVFQYAGDADASIDRRNPYMTALMDAIDERAREGFSRSVVQDVGPL